MRIGICVASGDLCEGSGTNLSDAFDLVHVFFLVVLSLIRSSMHTMLKLYCGNCRRVFTAIVVRIRATIPTASIWWWTFSEILRAASRRLLLLPPAEKSVAVA